MTQENDAQRAFLRHSLATLAYRGGKVLRGTNEAFGSFTLAGGTRTPVRILAHVGDLLDWTLSLCRGQEAWHDSIPESWENAVRRFFDRLRDVDDLLASPTVLKAAPERLFQGPVADALTHVGQIALLRRLAGDPVLGENYFRAEIAAGRVGPEQAAAVRELD
jgi:hypothetical protein